MAQQGVEQVGLKNHDLARSARMALYGGGMCSMTLSPSHNAD
jgi:protein Mpv17